MKTKDCDPVCRQIGILISNKRIELRMTMQELADKIGLSKGAIFNYEEGTRDIPVSNLVKISSVLGLSVSDLVPNIENLPVKVDRPKKVKKEFIIHGIHFNVESEAKAKKELAKALTQIFKKGI